ncbi:MAG: response regulator transcription factor [Bacteroidales bacterium]|nr:response regulator transcription factor [Bacteroidales bacterium]MCI1733183.1 response regulator transcription factor [Bacteroidales bacterium]
MINLLFVDDDVLTCKLFKSAFERHGYHVECCYNGKEALEKIRVYSPDCIITDIQMGVMDGNELIGKLKESRCNTPIIALTGNPKDISTLSADAYLPKPLNFDILTVTIAKLLKEKSLSAQSAEYEIGSYVFHAGNHTLIVNDEKIEMLPKEAMLLELLCKNLGKNVLRDDIAAVLWYGAEKNNIAHNLGTLVYNLRHYLAKDKNISITVVRGDSVRLEVG